MLNISEDDYINAVRSSLKEARVFHKREPDATRINGFNPAILQAWQANHDIQYVLDAYACAMYIVSYISKGQRGMSDLLRRTCEEAKESGSDIRSQVKAIGNKFSKNVEISGQEAVYIALQMPLRRSSTAFVFVNSSPSEERPFILKNEEMLKNLPDDSEDIQCSNVISRYRERPTTVSSMCLAEFAASYDLVTRKQKTKEIYVNGAEDNLEDEQDVPGAHEQLQIQLSNGSVLRKRKKKKILRSVRNDKKKDPENHYRELLMLYMPWRNEENIIADSTTYEDQYNLHKDQVDDKKSEFENLAEQVDMAEQRLQNSEVDEEMFDNIAPNVQDQELRDRTEDIQEAAKDDGLFTEYDIGPDIGLTTTSGTDQVEEQIRNRISDAQYRADVRSLNKKQRENILSHTQNSQNYF